MPASTMTSKGRVTIPKEVRERLALKEGDRLVFRFDDQGNLLLQAENSESPWPVLRNSVPPCRRSTRHGRGNERRDQAAHTSQVRWHTSDHSAISWKGGRTRRGRPVVGGEGESIESFFVFRRSGGDDKRRFFSGTDSPFRRIVRVAEEINAACGSGRVVKWGYSGERSR